MQILTAAVTAAALIVASAGSGSASYGSAGSTTRVPAAGQHVSAGPRYRAPLAGPVLVITPFAPPATRYGPGHLGVDLAAPAGVPVLAAGSAVVRFAGQVAGRGVVVLVHPDGISTEYEPVTSALVRGQPVVAGQRIGTVHGRHRTCGLAICLHWGARRGTTYLDPMALVEPLGVVRLLPWT